MFVIRFLCGIDITLFVCAPIKHVDEHSLISLLFMASVRDVRSLRLRAAVN